MSGYIPAPCEAWVSHSCTWRTRCGQPSTHHVTTLETGATWYACAEHRPPNPGLRLEIIDLRAAPTSTPRIAPKRKDAR